MLNDMSSGKCKIKQQDTTLHQLEWPKFLTLTMPNADEDVVQLELSFIVGGNAKWCPTLEDSLGASYKTKYILTTWSSNYVPSYLLKQVENL